MATRAELKARAKAQLGGGIFQQGWMMALAVCLIVSVAEGLAATVIPGLGALLITGPLAAGMAFCFMKQARGNSMEITDLGKGFTVDFGGTFLLGLMINIFTFLWSLLFVIPGIVKTYSYAMAFYVKVDHPEFGWNECIRESMRLMNGHKMELFILDLSFIGWYLVGALCCGIGTLWVGPYHFAARTQFYENLKNAPVIG